MPLSTSDTVPSRARATVDLLLLPSLRDRVRECLWFLALSQTIYIFILPFSGGELLAVQFALCALRLVIL